MTNLNVFSGTRVLITGHTGFKGSWLSLWLHSLGAKVVGISDKIPTTPSNFEAIGAENFVDHRTLNIENFREVLATLDEVKPDFIFHLAAQPIVNEAFENPLDTWKTNTLGTVNVLEAIRQHGHPVTAIFITSDKAYDNVEWEWGYRETDRLGGPDPYSASKGAAEIAINSYVRSYFDDNSCVRIGIGRAGNVIGGGDWAESRIVPDCARAWSSGNTVTLRNPNSTRPWQHVLEPLSGYLQLAIELHESPKLHGEAFNFGPSAVENHSVIQVVEGMGIHWDKVSWRIDPDFKESHQESRLLKLNCDKALFHLGWKSIWDFDQTILETTTWYRDYYSNEDISVFDLSLKQIQKYQELAKSVGMKWAQ